ncbi:ribonuclease H-like domain-containing protein [Tanacetum coccineum]
MNQFYEMKGILRHFSIAKNPQQNGVTERRNRTLIEDARTMLVDSKLPTTFWAEAVNTACYVKNRVLVVKPHNKTPYELFHGRTPTLSFIRPFGCHVTILNTIDHLGKFDGKADEGFFVGYSLNSKAFKVFNSRIRIVEENLHIRFSESTPNVVGSGPDWLFDIDALTRTMNYEPIISGTQSNSFAGTKASDNACQARKKTKPVKYYILLPLWTAHLPFCQNQKSSHGDGSKPSSDDGKKGAYGCILVGIRGSTPEFSGPAFEAVVQRAVDALLPGLTTYLTNEICQNGARGIDAENWIAHIEKIFEVLGCADEFKARLASYKLEGDALNWSEQQKYERVYHMIRQRDGETSGEFMKRFLRLAGFVGKKTGPLEEQAQHFKWALFDWILDGIVNTNLLMWLKWPMMLGTWRFSVRGQVRITRETVMGTVFNRQLRVAIKEGMIRRVMTVAVMTGRMETIIRRHGRTEVRSTTVLLGLQVRLDTRTMPPLLHVTHMENFIWERHVTRLLELVSLVVRLGIWPGIALRMMYHFGNSLLEWSCCFFILFDTGATYSVSDHEDQNCPLRFDEEIRFANLLPLEMSDFDIILGMDWLAEHRAAIVCHTNRVIFGDLDNPEFIYLFQFRFEFRG